MPKLTKTAVDNAKAPATGDAWIWDSELEGFGVRVQSSGRKTYVIRYRTRDAKRTQRKLTIARCSDMPPEKARDLARKEFAKVADGHDPAAERKPERVEASKGITLEAMFKARVAAMREKGRANATENERVLLTAAYNAADVIGRNKRPCDVTPDDVIRFVSKHYQDGCRGAADKARGYLAAAFTWAIKSANDYTVTQRKDWGLKFNPVQYVAKDHGAIGVRDRNLSTAELVELWHACGNGCGGFSREIEVMIRLMIACGQRVQETLRVEGAELNLDAGYWNIPKHKTKGKKADHKIPLPAIIIPDLKDLKAKHGDGLLFPARAGAKADTISPISVLQAIKRWLAEEDTTVEAFQTRDLRRTWKSRTHDAGIDRFVRDLIQQHSKNSDTGSKHYDRADYFPQMREAMDKWSAWLSKATSPAPVIKIAA